MCSAATCREVSRSMTPLTDSPYLVSALVSTYGSERFIRGCLADLEAQTIADRVEIIVVDSCSPQNERAVVEEFQEQYDNIKYIRTERRETVYHAWNRAAQAAAGRYLTNANTDDRHRPDAFEILARELEDRPDCAVAYADCAVTRNENQRLETADIVGYFKWPDPEAKAPSGAVTSVRNRCGGDRCTHVMAGSPPK